MDKSGDARRRSTVGLGVTVAVLGLGLVVGTMASGPLRAGSPLWLPTSGRGIPRPALPAPVQTTTAAPLPQTHLSPAQLQQWLLWGALVAVVAAGILVYLLRRLVRRSRLLSEERDGAMTAAGSTAPPARTDDPVAPVMASGIAKAIRLLDEAREPHDAIVRAWLGLQEAAQASGAGRRPAETPGEYTARIVARFGTDRDAARMLLDLYQGVRFGGHPADGNTVDLARSCLATLRDSWHDDAGQRPGAPQSDDQGRTR